MRTDERPRSTGAKVAEHRKVLRARTAVTGLGATRGTKAEQTENYKYKSRMAHRVRARGRASGALTSTAVLLLALVLVAASRGPTPERARSRAESPAAKPETLRVGERLRRFDLLKPGVHRYLRYTVSNGRRNAIGIWSRTISLEDSAGARRMRIHLRSDYAGGSLPLTLDQDATFESGTLRPFTHVWRRQHGDTVAVAGYRFLLDRIVGMNDLPDNARKEFSIALAEPAFNFEYDAELLQALRLEQGVSVSAEFDDPGFDSPVRYTFVVAGTESIEGPDGRPIDCWLVTSDYNTGRVVSRFWFAKRSQLLVREEAPTANGGLLVKILLSPEA
jgi:hypothetical protein